MVNKFKEKRLIVVADDFGYHTNINTGIISCAEKGIVTSASVLVYGDDIESVVRFKEKNPNFDLGLHVVIDRLRSKDLNNLTLKITLPFFLEQLRVFYKIFQKKPSNFSFHHSHTIFKLITNKKKQFLLNLSLRVLEEKTKVPIRQSVVDSTSTFAVENSLEESVTSFIHLISSIKNGLNLIITHPGKKIQVNYTEKPFVSTYSLIKRDRETRVLTKQSIKDVIKYKSIILTDFTNVKS